MVRRLEPVLAVVKMTGLGLVLKQESAFLNVVICDSKTSTDS